VQGMDTERRTPQDARGRPLDPDDYLSTEDLSVRIDIPVQTLHVWRTRGGGPPAARVGRHLRYRWGDVVDWLAERTSATA